MPLRVRSRERHAGQHLGFGFIQPDGGGADAFVHVSAVERAGMSMLSEGQKIEFDLVADRRSGKMSADNLKAQAA